MSQPVQEYIAERIGQTWTADDAAYVADKIRKIEQLAESVVLRVENALGNAGELKAFTPPRNR